MKAWSKAKKKENLWLMQSYHFGFGNMRLWVINKMLNKSANNYGIAFLSSSGHGSNLITTKIFLRGTAQPAYDVKQSNLFSSKRWPCLSCLVIILLMHRYRTLLMTGSCQRGFCGFSWCHLQTTWCWDLNLGQPWTLFCAIASWSGVWLPVFTDKATLL